MLAGIVPLSQSLSLRVALIVQGVDVEFGESARGYQRFDIFDADMTRTRDVLGRFPRVVVGRAKRKVQSPDASLLKRPQLISSKESD